MTRILARNIIFEGKNYPMSVVEVSDDQRQASITAFVRETANTVWVDGCVELLCIDGVYSIKCKV